MKKIIYFSLSALLTLSLASCRGRQQPTPIVEENIEYRPLVTDSAAIDSINNSGMVDNDASMEYPEMPEDAQVNMKANDDEIKDVINGTGDGDMTKEEGNF